MAHKLGAMFHVPHGVANALLIRQVIKYNAVDYDDTKEDKEYPRTQNIPERIRTNARPNP